MYFLTSVKFFLKDGIINRLNRSVENVYVVWCLEDLERESTQVVSRNKFAEQRQAGDERTSHNVG